MKKLFPLLVLALLVMSCTPEETDGGYHLETISFNVDDPDKKIMVNGDIEDIGLNYASEVIINGDEINIIVSGVTRQLIEVSHVSDVNGADIKVTSKNSFSYYTKDKGNLSFNIIYMNK